ncbi:MAG: sensor histidine kinase, partial [Candidatus Eremiobacterota bacterium]
GVPEEELPHLFERFFRAEKNKERVGTGLGLPIVKEIIEAHKGKITVKNNLPSGLDVFICLPVEQLKG